MTKQQLLSEAQQLAPKERAELIEELWQSIIPGELDVKQRGEITRRIAQIDRGEVELVDGELAMQNARRRVAQMRKL